MKVASSTLRRGPLLVSIVAVPLGVLRCWIELVLTFQTCLLAAHVSC